LEINQLQTNRIEVQKKELQELPARAPRKHAKAATSDILGLGPKPIKVNPKWKDHYDKLTELRDRFIDQRGNLVKDATEEAPNFSEHMADAGTDSYDRDFTLSLLSSEQNALYEIEQALKRIEDGTFGVCEISGQPIQAERLEAIPWARFSADAERDLEARGVVAHARLGDLGSLTSNDSSAEDGEAEEES
jgi:RNA polymerase-binding transcription factor DksA